MVNTGYTLIISVGNSNVLFGVFAGDKYLGKWRMETRQGRTADEYGQFLLGILYGVGVEAAYISGAIVSCVVPSISKVMTSMCRRFFEVDPFHVAPGIKTGMHINYGRAGDLGPDRLANIIALNALGKTPAVVVDFGTTTSFDVIGEDGKYLGGLIAPGVALSLSSLSSVAPQLPDVAIQKPEWVIGKSIAQSMQSGCYLGAIEMVEGLVRRIWNEAGIEKGYCVATGGYAKDMLVGTDLFDEVDTHFTLRGLKLIYDRNIP